MGGLFAPLFHDGAVGREGVSNRPLRARTQHCPNSYETDLSTRRRPIWIVASMEDSMNGIIYIVGLIVVVMFILSFLGLR